MTVAPLLSSCTIQIPNTQWCSPVIDQNGNVLVVACDNFSTSNPIVLTGDQWTQKQLAFIAAGTPLECTDSTSLGDIKKAIEQLCSVSKCDYATQQAITAGLEKIQGIGVYK